MEVEMRRRRRPEMMRERWSYVTLELAPAAAAVAASNGSSKSSSIRKEEEEPAAPTIAAVEVVDTVYCCTCTSTIRRRRWYRLRAASGEVEGRAEGCARRARGLAVACDLGRVSGDDESDRTMLRPGPLIRRWTVFRLLDEWHARFRDMSPPCCAPYGS
uniref:Uncharacterized protein n=1 Tax=Oryza brachyantha TaxID=4533 RepID=J3L6C2_ORYBR